MHWHNTHSSLSICGGTGGLVGVAVSGLARPDVNAELATARRLCEQRGERATAPRMAMLEILLRSDHPLRAYDVLGRFGPNGAAKPTTIYRALAFWERMGRVRRIETLNAWVALPSSASSEMVFFLCRKCGAVDMKSIGGAREIHAQAGQMGFDIARVALEVQGECARCRTVTCQT